MKHVVDHVGLTLQHPNATIELSNDTKVLITGKVVLHSKGRIMSGHESDITV